MSTDQQAKYANMVKGNATAEEYANRYIQEKLMVKHKYDTLHSKEFA
jgi:hypothetical protein